MLLHFCVRMFLKGHLNIQENTSSMTYFLAPTNSLVGAYFSQTGFRQVTGEETLPGFLIFIFSLND